TRSHGIGAASAAADGHVPVVREEKHRPLVFLAQTDRGADAVHPGDIVEAALRRRRLPLLDAPADPCGQLRNRPRRAGKDARRRQAHGAYCEKETFHGLSPRSGLRRDCYLTRWRGYAARLAIT